MAYRLHTRVSDDIREACTHDGIVDTEQQAEMRAESEEYRNEIMGYYDNDDDFDDDDDELQDFWDEAEEDQSEDDAYEGPEDFGWDGGMEE